MRFQGAVIKEQGVTFAIAVVKPRVIQNRAEAVRVASGFGSVFPGVPIVLMAQDSKGTPTYYGRKDLVRFLSKVPVRAIPWKEYSVT
jgi:hypothetical protein